MSRNIAIQLGGERSKLRQEPAPFRLSHDSKRRNNTSQHRRASAASTEVVVKTKKFPYRRCRNGKIKHSRLLDYIHTLSPPVLFFFFFWRRSVISVSFIKPYFDHGAVNHFLSAEMNRAFKNLRSKEARCWLATSLTAASSANLSLRRKERELNKAYGHAKRCFTGSQGGIFFLSTPPSPTRKEQYPFPDTVRVGQGEWVAVEYILLYGHRSETAY